MRRYGRRNAKRGEIIAMTITSVFVLSVLTLTGVYIKQRNSVQEQDGYYVDFDALEAELNEKVNQVEVQDDLDYTGTQEEYDFTVQNAEAVQSGSIEKENQNSSAKVEESITVSDEQTAEVLPEEIPLADGENVSLETTQPATSTDAVTNLPAITFSEDEALVWPVVGNILINYSMDKSVYFATLDQYKYNPAIIISATEGEQITAATDAIITNIYESNELGNVVEMDLGDGYKLTYGQLKNIVVNVGQYVTTGQIIAEANSPTAYYSVEGCNVYFKLTKDGEPINPMTLLE